MSWTSLCELQELQDGQGKYAEISGFQLAIFLDKGQVYVMDNHCPHAGGSMSAGFIDEGCAVCPWHYWAFKLESGELRDWPGVTIPTYKTRLVERENQPTLVQADLPIF
jgi:nitrite reductase (NADH) small subunit